LVELQVSMDAPPPPMVDGAALIDTMGCNGVPGELAPPPQAASNSDTAAIKSRQ
jgi:hypothetical protein